jgi:uncharacterized protein with von Willebrand factor type A (vWA) domain
MQNHFDKLSDILKLPRNSHAGWVGVYTNMRKLLEAVIKDNLGTEKYEALPENNKMVTSLDNFCYNINIEKKEQDYLHSFRKRANQFIHGDYEVNGKYFEADLYSLCEAIAKATRLEIPDEIKNVYQKNKPAAIEKNTNKKIPRFDKFTKFGSIADEQVRKKIAEQTYNNVTEIGLPLENEDKQIDLYADAINSILNNDSIYDITNGNAELSEKITSDILDFINKTKKLVDKTETPLASEITEYIKFSETTIQTFKNDWEKTKLFIKEIYDKNQIDIDFYDKEFARCFDRKNKKRPNFNSIKEYFTDKWWELLYKKEIARELEIIDRERKKFCEELYKKIEEFKKLQEILKPITNEFGRLWDMSSGNWRQTNFDILKKYAEFLEKDKSLNELAEMLGKMRKAEQEYEEELFTDIRPKTVWKTENTAKSDLIGVHESDDISNALPSEFALLADPATEMLFFKKYAEKKLQTFEYQGRTQEIIDEEFQNKRQKAKEDSKGPFIICVDTSGSMQGTPEIVAKTLCFAILKIAIRDNRKCYLISFSTGIETLNLTDLKNSSDKIIQFLLMSFYGGTDATPAMNESLRMLKTQDYKKADVIVVSDFVMPSFDEAIQKQILEAKTSKTKFHSLIIGTSQNKGVIKDFDNNWLYDVNNSDRVLNLVKDINEL